MELARGLDELERMTVLVCVGVKADADTGVALVQIPSSVSMKPNVPPVDDDT